MDNRYDTAFRTMINDCQELVLPLINEMFGEHYTGKEQIVPIPNEHFFRQRTDELPNMKEIITDSCFQVVESQKSYHLECQSTEDSGMIVRMFEYDTQIALDNGLRSRETLTVRFPYSGVLSLRGGEQNPDSYRYVIESPGGTLDYEIPVIKMKQYTMDEIFEKKLLFLLPFYIFVHEDNFGRYEQDEEQLEVLKEEYLHMAVRLNRMEEDGEVTVSDVSTIYNTIRNVMDAIAANYENVRKGMGDLMRGPVFETDVSKIKEELVTTCRSKWVAEGEAKGRLQMLYDLVATGMMTEADAASVMHLKTEEFHTKYLQNRAEKRQKAAEQKIKGPKL